MKCNYCLIHCAIIMRIKLEIIILFIDIKNFHAQRRKIFIEIASQRSKETSVTVVERAALIKVLQLLI